MLKLLAGVVLTATIFSTGVVAADQQPVESSEETLLMFVGETEPVVTVASRLPESPTTAPAMVTVVSRDQIDRHGYRTLAEVLNDQVGFYMSAGGRGTVPYLRGLRDSILFLYDGVPLATDVTKNFSVLDREISLDAIERIEIVRGAGSVLWGADAFAGVVNIVPKSGQPQAGVEAGLEVGNDDLYGGTLNWARSEHDWDAFLAAAGLRETLDDADSSHYGELVGTLNLGGWLHLSGRWSDFERNYTMNEKGAEDIRSPGTREAPVNYLKATASKVHGPSHYTLMGFYQSTDFKLREQLVDGPHERSQRNHVWHAELNWDRRIMSRGLLTLGASWRRTEVDDAAVRNDFSTLPLPGGGSFVPLIDQADFTNDLGSLYAQFRYQLWQGEWWAGLRLDDHSEYESTLSYSLGMHQPLGEDFNLKVAYGTAFRSPYSSQLFFNNQAFDPESVQTISVQLAWEADRGHSLELTLYHSDIDDHIAEDPYGGLSQPSGRQIYGLELVGQARLTPTVTLNAGFTAMDSSGDEEHFRVVDGIFIRPDGTVVPISYKEWDEPVDEGPSWLADFGLSWEPAKGHNLTIGGRIGGDYDYSYEYGTIEGDYDYPLVIDASYSHPGFFAGKDKLTLRATNLLDRDYKQPDVYGPVDGPPLQISLEWKYRF